MWCQFGHVTLGYPRQPNPRTPPCGFGVWCLVFGVWCLVCGVWCLVFGVWCLVLGVGCLFFFLLCVCVFDVWSLEVEVWGIGVRVRPGLGWGGSSSSCSLLLSSLEFSDTKVYGVGFDGVPLQLLRRNLKRFRAGLVFKAHRLFVTKL